MDRLICLNIEDMPKSLFPHRLIVSGEFKGETDEGEVKIFQFDLSIQVSEEEDKELKNSPEFKEKFLTAIKPRLQKRITESFGIATKIKNIIENIDGEPIKGYPNDGKDK